jgi:hypothetical protein
MRGTPLIKAGFGASSGAPAIAPAQYWQEWMPGAHPCRQSTSISYPEAGTDLK